ncbi:MAG: shikimate dehydrogenase [Cellulosilyticaceae bacterium]
MKNINGTSSVCGIIGSPIEHTLSPLIHNTINEILNNNSVYVPFNVTTTDFEEVVKGAYTLGIQGINVTMPYKQLIMPCLDEIDDTAKKAHAVNTLVKTEEGYKGYNTDINGLKRAMECQNISIKNKKIAIIGSGGAGIAACLCVIEEAKSLILFNRTIDNAQNLKNRLEYYYKIPVEVGDYKNAGKINVDIVIQASGVGMGELKDIMPECSNEVLEHADIAIDLIYNPKETLFLKTAREKGIKTMNGFDMLFYQAIEAYEKMHNITISNEKMRKIKNKIENKLNEK